MRWLQGSGPAPSLKVWQIIGRKTSTTVGIVVDVVPPDGKLVLVEDAAPEELAARVGGAILLQLRVALHLIPWTGLRTNKTSRFVSHSLSLLQPYLGFPICVHFCACLCAYVYLDIYSFSFFQTTKSKLTNTS